MRPRRTARPQAGLHYDPRFVNRQDRAEMVDWLSTLHPIWEERYPTPPPPGQEQRRLLRPVYWLGSWQFACLDYYRPPNGVVDRAVRAEPFPPVLIRLLEEIEWMAREMFHGPPDLPAKWRLNTCLVNFYGSRVEPDGRRIDGARVGEHRDFEPGPVASISLGERALFQFVSDRAHGTSVVAQQWLDDGSLQIFGGDAWKKKNLHRVQRVDRRAGARFEIHVPEFETRRVNLTFRFVPEEHIRTFATLSKKARDDVRGYVTELARHSPFFARALAEK